VGLSVQVETTPDQPKITLWLPGIGEHPGYALSSMVRVSRLVVQHFHVIRGDANVRSGLSVPVLQHDQAAFDGDAICAGSECSGVLEVITPKEQTGCLDQTIVDDARAPVGPVMTEVRRVRIRKLPLLVNPRMERWSLEIRYPVCKPDPAFNVKCSESIMNDLATNAVSSNDDFRSCQHQIVRYDRPSSCASRQHRDYHEMESNINWRDSSCSCRDSLSGAMLVNANRLIVHTAPP
jgi:hypothetical protein